MWYDYLWYRISHVGRITCNNGNSLMLRTASTEISFMINSLDVPKKHDSLSGDALIIGLATKKVLHVGVRNKHCAVCMKAQQLQKDPCEHKCYKNWGRDQSSTAMEADIIVEGFK